MNAYVTFLKITMLENDMYIYIYIYKIASTRKERPWLGTAGITLGTPHLEHHHQTFPKRHLSK